MKTLCTVTLFFQGQSMDILLHLDLQGSVDEQIEKIYGDKIDDYVYETYSPFGSVSDNQLFSMYNKSNDYKRKQMMKKELCNRGYFQ
jgi:hypothetical protein